MSLTEVAPLVDRAAEGDEQAWDDLVSRFAGLVWSIAMGYGLSRADVADVSQTCWLRLAENLHRITDRERVGAWLATTARRESLAVVKRGRRQVPSGVHFEDEQSLDPESDSSLLRQERSAAVLVAFARTAAGLSDAAAGAARRPRPDLRRGQREPGDADRQHRSPPGPLPRTAPGQRRAAKRRASAVRVARSRARSGGVRVIDLPEDDDVLARELGTLLRRSSPMPASIAAAARGAFAWRSVDADLAVLRNDSLLEATVGVRGGADRQLTFASETVSVEVDVLDGGRRIVGQVVPPQPGSVDVEGPHRRAAVQADAFGQFALDVVNGPARLRFSGADGRTVITDWVTL